MSQEALPLCASHFISCLYKCPTAGSPGQVNFLCGSAPYGLSGAQAFSILCPMLLQHLRELSQQVRNSN